MSYPAASDQMHCITVASPALEGAALASASVLCRWYMIRNVQQVCGAMHHVHVGGLLQARAKAAAAARKKAAAAAALRYIQQQKAAQLAAAIARVTYPTPVGAPIQYGGGAIQGQARHERNMFQTSSGSADRVACALSPVSKQIAGSHDT